MTEYNKYSVIKWFTFFFLGIWLLQRLLKGEIEAGGPARNSG